MLVHQASLLLCASFSERIANHSILVSRLTISTIVLNLYHAFLILLSLRFTSIVDAPVPRHLHVPRYAISKVVPVKWQCMELAPSFFGIQQLAAVDQWVALVNFNNILLNFPVTYLQSYKFRHPRVLYRQGLGQGFLSGYALDDASLLYPSKRGRKMLHLLLSNLH